MLRMVGVAMIGMLGACVAASGPLTVTWSHSGESDSAGVSDPVVCTTTISHPCPFLLYTTTLDASDGQLTWGNAVGGADINGVPASQRLPVVEPMTLDNTGSIVLAQRGDDGGERRSSVLAPTPDGGWSGDVTWTLFTVAGDTKFHVVIAPH